MPEATIHTWNGSAQEEVSLLQWGGSAYVSVTAQSI